MNSLIEDKQFQTGNFDTQLNKSTKLLSKSYSFFIFYNLHATPDQKLKNLEKLSFRLRENAKSQNEKYLDTEDKVVSLSFADLNHQTELQSCFIDLKFHIVEKKIKIVIFGYESDLFKLVDKTAQFGIDLKAVPFAIYSPEMNDDLATLLGWRLNAIANIAGKQPNQLSHLSRQWMTSPSEKIDVWQAVLKVHENGKISRLCFDPISNEYALAQFPQVTQKTTHFMSHLTIGYHSKAFLQLSSSQKPVTQSMSFFNRLAYNFLGMKKFCCLGDMEIKSSTGIVNVSYKDEEREIQIMKEFFNEQQMGSKKSGRKVLSIVLASIPLYNGQKVQSCRMNDNKIQLLAFQAKNSFQQIGSIGGQIKMKFQTQKQVYIKVADSCYVLERPKEIVVKQAAKMRALVNKETVGC